MAFDFLVGSFSLCPPFVRLGEIAGDLILDSSLELVFLWITSVGTIGFAASRHVHL